MKDTKSMIYPSSMLCFAPKEAKRKKKAGPAHLQCINVRYDGYGPDRTHVPLQRISWIKSFPRYMPSQYTSEDVLSKPQWADPPMDSPKVRVPAYNQLDGPVDRRSHHGNYKLDEGVPRNPRGRTGMIGRGVLGRWGPNHTATPIITRWARDKTGALREVEGKRVLETVAVRSRTGWALPCELVVPEDKLGFGTRRAFLTELVRNKTRTAAEDASKSLSQLFAEGTVIYRGYVDDAKNTDNAWLETVSVNFHDNSGTKFGSFRLAEDFTWVEAHFSLNVFAQHKEWLREVVELHRAHW
ncbi:ADP-ribose pyrophosphatase, mitochondrial-like isoform X2 [Bolinopsis microptera]|uniref:ADP-ribose pyrophosphatase, mitochondrial-like isoform X2 n=1 Tax=Bolinopsis microptera TaxID=2820187 RepID=UPI003079DB27